MTNHVTTVAGAAQGFPITGHEIKELNKAARTDPGHRDDANITRLGVSAISALLLNDLAHVARQTETHLARLAGAMVDAIPTATVRDASALPSATGGFAPWTPTGVPPASQIGSEPICDAGGTPVGGAGGQSPPPAGGDAEGAGSRAAGITSARVSLDAASIAALGHSLAEALAQALRTTISERFERLEIQQAEMVEMRRAVRECREFYDRLTESHAKIEGIVQEIQHNLRPQAETKARLPARRV